MKKKFLLKDGEAIPKEDVIFILFFFFLSIFIALHYVTNGITTGKDSGAFFLSFEESVERRFFLWDEMYANGQPYFYNLIGVGTELLGFLFGSLVATFLYYFFLFFISLFGSYILLIKILIESRKILKNLFLFKISCFFGSLFYLFNPLSVVYRMGGSLVGGTVFYFTTPLLLFLVLKYFEINNIKEILRISITLAILFLVFGGGFREIHRLIILFPVFFAYYIFLSFQNRKKLAILFKMPFFKLVLISLLFLPYIISIITTSFYQLKVAYKQIDPIANLNFFKSNHKEIFSILLYPSRLWNGIYAYNNFYFEKITILSWLFILILLFLPIFFFRKGDIIDKKRKHIFIVTLSFFVFSITLSLIPKGPLGPIFEWFFYRSSFLQVYRTPYDKFNTFPPLFGSILFTISVYSLLIARMRYKSYERKKGVFTLIMIFLVLSMVYLSIPALTGLTAYGYYGKLTKSYFNNSLFSDWYSLRKYSENGKMLFLPPVYSIWIDSIFGYYGLDYLEKVLIGNHITYAYRVNNLTDSLHRVITKDILNNNDCEYIRDILTKLKVKYIVFRNDLNLTDQSCRYGDSQITNTVKNFHYICRCLNLSLIDKLNYYDIYYFSDSTLFEILEEKNATFNVSKINPTLWEVQINATKPFMLSFAESYDPLWEAKVYKDGKPVEKVKSIPLYGVINGFWINETGNLQITIRYTPQDWFEIGLAISATTFIACIFYLFYDWRKQKGDRWTKRIEKKFNKFSKAYISPIFLPINKTFSNLEKFLAKKYKVLKKKLPKIRIRYIKLPSSLQSNLPFVLVALSILSSHFLYPQNDLAVFLSFIALVPIFAYFKFDGRIPVAYALLMLVLAAITLAFYKNENLANQLAIYAYWLLVVGVTCLAIEYLREQRKSY